MSATQFSLLFANGLRDHHRVLDFGCGSLRLGRLLIPYLQEGRYFGIEPNAWLIHDALEHEIGRDIIRVKKPMFSHRDDYDCASLESSFHFIIAQSIVTHCGPDLFRKLMKSFASVLEPDGLILFSYLPSQVPVDSPRDGWHYPACVPYDEPQVSGFLAEAGLLGASVPWYHPGASWHVASRSQTRLPSEEECRLLTGAVLFDPQFVASRANAVGRQPECKSPMRTTILLLSRTARTGRATIRHRRTGQSRRYRFPEGVAVLSLLVLDYSRIRAVVGVSVDAVVAEGLDHSPVRGERAGPVPGNI